MLERNHRRFYGADRNEHDGEGVSKTGIDSSVVEEENAVPQRFHDTVLVRTACDHGCNYSTEDLPVVDDGGFHGDAGPGDIRWAHTLRYFRDVGRGVESDSVAPDTFLPRSKTRTLKQ